MNRFLLYASTSRAGKPSRLIFALIKIKIQNVSFTHKKNIGFMVILKSYKTCCLLCESFDRIVNDLTNQFFHIFLKYFEI
jgi:hypothetical protein